MARKRFAVLMAGLNRGGYLSEFSAGMEAACSARDIDLCIFNAQGYVDSAVESFEAMESMIFELPDLSRFDGIVALPSTFSSTQALDRVTALLRTLPEIPKVLVDRESDTATTLFFNDDTSVTELMRHLIRDHGYKRFALVGGPKDNPVAIHRIGVALTTLIQEGGSVDGQDIMAGNWTREGGVLCGTKLIQEARIPDAIVCMNDDMALGVMDALESAGYRIPEDVAVTGFDSRVEALGSGLTTIKRPVREAGQSAVEELLRQISGGEPRRIVLPTVIEYGHTCGCTADKVQSRHYLTSLARAVYRADRTMMRASAFSRAVFSVEDKKQTGEVFSSFARSWGINKFYVCVTKDFPKPLLFKNDLCYPDEVLLLSGCDGSGVLPQQVFPTKDLLPSQADDSKPSALVFSPLYYSDRVFGYAVMDLAFSSSLTMYSVLMLLASALMSLSQQSIIRSYATDVENMSHHDPLTGLLNRRGYARRAGKLVQEAYEQQRVYMAVSVDLDGMKYINDTFGHAAGDQAICRMGRAMHCLQDFGLECVHISGDEFLAIGIMPRLYMEKSVHDALADSMRHMNELDPWLTPLTASIGVYSAVPEEGQTLDHFTKLADRAMYEEKRMHHKAARK